MTIPLKKLIGYNGNKYIFTRACIRAIDKIVNIKDYSTDNENWKIVPQILEFMLDGKLKYDLDTDKKEKLDK